MVLPLKTPVLDTQSHTPVCSQQTVQKISVGYKLCLSNHLWWNTYNKWELARFILPNYNSSECTERCLRRQRTMDSFHVFIWVTQQISKFSKSTFSFQN